MNSFVSTSSLWDNFLYLNKSFFTHLLICSDSNIYNAYVCMSTCVYVCVWACTYVCICESVCVCSYVDTYECMGGCMCVCVYLHVFSVCAGAHVCSIYMFLRVHGHMCANVRPRTCVCPHACVHTWKCIWLYMCTVNTYMQHCVYEYACMCVSTMLND